MLCHDASGTCLDTVWKYYLSPRLEKQLSSCVLFSTSGCCLGRITSKLVTTLVCGQLESTAVLLCGFDATEEATLKLIPRVLQMVRNKNCSQVGKLNRGDGLSCQEACRKYEMTLEDSCKCRGAHCSPIHEPAGLEHCKVERLRGSQLC